MSFFSTYKIPQPRGYSEGVYYIEDNTATSPDYFAIEDFPTVMGGGRHIIKLKGNGTNMRLNSSIDVEIIDAEGQRIFCEVVNYSDRFNNYYISVDIYDITAQGVATAYFVGEAILDFDGNKIPEEYADRYNVRWTKQFAVLPFERNNSELIFDNPPQVSVAQIVVPAREVSTITSGSTPFSTVTSSINLLSIEQSNFQGYDRDFASSPAILDTRLKSIVINPVTKPLTENTVPTAVRESDQDIDNGSKINYTTRFGTILKATSSFFSKEFLGSYFEFFNSESTPRNLQPALPSGVTVSGSTADQLQYYGAAIVEVVNSTQAILSQPIKVNTVDTNYLTTAPSTFTYKKVSNFTGSITYAPSTTTFITSSAISSSYVEFTFADLNPVGGQVYRIKTSTKLGAINGDYKLLNDQVVSPVEYLTDAEFPNGLGYAKHDSEYRLIGHFTTANILNTYWNHYIENPSTIAPTTSSWNNSILIESTPLAAAYTQSMLLTTKFDQNYNEDQTYTLSFYATLDPYTSLEVYMSSDPLNTNIFTPITQPRAFIKSTNNEKATRPGASSRFGKYIGKITNDSASRKYYGKVLFDFATDASGFGKPVIRSTVVDQMSGYSGSVYVGEISVKPYTINGFTPNIVQYAVPLSTELINATVLSQSIDFKIDYFDYTGRQSEYTTYLDDVVLNLKAEIQSNTCQTDKLNFWYNSNADQGLIPEIPFG